MTSMTLRTLLTRLIWLCMLPLIALAVWLGLEFVDSARTNAERAADRLAHNIAAAINHELDARLGGLQMLAGSAPPGDAVALPALYRQAQAYRESFGSEVLLADLAGRMRFHTARPYGEPLPPMPRPSGRSAVAAAIASQRPAVGDLFVGPIAGEPLVALAAPELEEGRPAFVWVSLLPARRFTERLQAFTVPAGWAIELRDSTGASIARSRAAGATALDRLVLPLAAAPWSLVLEVPRAESTAPLVQAAVAMVLTITGATLVGALGGGWAARRLAHPVRALAEPQPAAGASGIVEVDAARALLDRSQAALRLREAQLRAIVESASDAILTVDDTHTIVLANGAAARMFGTADAALPGRPLDSLIPQRHRAAHRRAIEAFGETGRSARAMGRGGPVLHALRDDGEEFPIEAAISHVVVDGRHLYTVILRDISERLRAERALQDSHAQLQHLLAAHDRVQEEERKRIARELHDDLQQTLAAVLMETELVRTGLAGEAPAAREALARLHRLAAGAITSTRRIVNDLRPQMLEELGLVAALELLAHRFGEQTGLVCEMERDHFTSEQGPHGSAVDLCLFRVAQEALNNVAKHAQARHVVISLAITPAGHRTLAVQDDGRGLAPGDRGRAGSFGLLGMAERVHAIGGTLHIEGPPGRGTLVRVDVAPTPQLPTTTPPAPAPSTAPAPRAEPAPPPAPPP